MSDSQIAPWRETLWEELRNLDYEKICLKAAMVKCFVRRFSEND